MKANFKKQYKYGIQQNIVIIGNLKKSMRKFILCTASLALFYSSNSTLINDLGTNRVGSLVQDTNYIVNGNFDSPQLSAKYEVVKNLPGWTSDEIQRGQGNVYNANWGTTMVVELDGNHNNILKQSISLESGRYVLSFKWAGRTSYVSTSAMSVYWNNQKIFEVTAKDNTIHSQNIPIQVSQSGNYVLQIRGEGKSDSLGMTIANFKLRKQTTKTATENILLSSPSPPQPILVSQPQNQIVSVPLSDSLPAVKTQSTSTSSISNTNCDKNYIVNGNFDSPQLSAKYEVVKNLPGWTSDEIQRGQGNVYNANWGTTMVVELDGNHNNILKQSISLESGRYVLSFKWAGRTSYVSTSAMSVYWNNQKIFEVTAKDNTIHSQNIPIQVSQSGNYVLQFRGEGKSDSLGMTIANLKFTNDCSTKKVTENILLSSYSPQPQVEPSVKLQLQPLPQPQPEPSPSPVLVTIPKIQTISAPVPVTQTLPHQHCNLQQLIVKLNDQVIGYVQPDQDQFQVFSKSFKVLKPGHLRLQIATPNSKPKQSQQKKQGCPKKALKTKQNIISFEHQESDQDNQVVKVPSIHGG